MPRWEGNAPRPQSSVGIQGAREEEEEEEEERDNMEEKKKIKTCCAVHIRVQAAAHGQHPPSIDARLLRRAQTTVRAREGEDKDDGGVSAHVVCMKAPVAKTTVQPRSMRGADCRSQDDGSDSTGEAKQGGSLP